MGTYQDYGYSPTPSGYGGPYLFSSKFDGDEVLDNDGTTGYGGIYGFTGGLWAPADETGTSGDVDLHAAALAWSEEGWVKLLTGAPTGTYQGGYGGYNGFWEVSGTLAAPTMTLPEGYDPYEARIRENWIGGYGGLVGSFAGTDVDNIFGRVRAAKTKFIRYYDESIDGGEYASLPFGIYNLKYGNWSYPSYFFNMPDGPTVDWTAVVGGYGGFGYRWDEDQGYWRGTIASNWYNAGDGGTIDGTLTGTYLTMTHIGSISGSFDGLFDIDGYGGFFNGGFYGGYHGSWVGLSVGSYQATQQLNFGAEVAGGGGDSTGSLIYNDSGVIEDSQAGYAPGIFGLTAAGNNYDVLGMGAYQNYGYDEPLLYSSKFDGYEVTGFADTSGYGGIWGFTGGIWAHEAEGETQGDVDLYAAALGWSEEGWVKLLTGSLSGDFYHGSPDGYVGYWEVTGTLIGQNMTLPDTYDPWEATIRGNNINDYGIGGELIGQFDGTDIENIFAWHPDEYAGRTKFIRYYDESLGYGGSYASLPFGVYNLKYGAWNSPSYFFNMPDGPSVDWTAIVGGYGGFGYRWSDKGYWQADIASSWYNAGYGGTIDGTLTGTYVTLTHTGTMTGAFDGLFDIYGYGGFFNDEFYEGYYGSWVGLSVGSYQAVEQLEFGAMLGDGSGGALLYGDESNLMGMGSPKETHGIFGFNEVNSSTLALTGMGTFNNPMGMRTAADMYGGGMMYGGYGGGFAANIWHASFDGPEVKGANADTSGYGGITGYSSGLWQYGYTGGYGGHYTGTGDINITIAGLAWSEEDQTASLLTGTPTGTFTGSQFGYSGYWQMSGSINRRVMPVPDDFAVDEDTWAEDREIGNVGFLFGLFDVDDFNTIFGEMIPNGSKTSFITYRDGNGDRQSLPWGIFNMKFGLGFGPGYGGSGYGGTAYIPFNNPFPFPGDTMGPWTATVGGYGGFGYNSEGQGDGWSDEGMYIAQVTGPGWVRSDDPSMFHGTVEASLSGNYLTYTHRGTMTGTVYGLFESPPFWVGTSVGTYESTQTLEFSGDWGYGGSGRTYFYDPFYTAGTGYFGAFDIDGMHEGIIGGIENPDTSLTIWGMGLFTSDNEGYGGQQYISAWTEGGDVNVTDGDTGGFLMASVGVVDGYGGSLTGAAVAARWDEDGSNGRLYTGSSQGGSIYAIGEGLIPMSVGYWDITGTLQPGTAGFSGHVSSFLTNSGSYGGGLGSISLDEIAFEDAPEIPGEPFGLSVFALTGSATGYGGDGSWELLTEFDGGDNRNYIQVKGGSWDMVPPAPGAPDNAFGGNLSGAWVSFTNGDTGVLGGEVRGLFDPVDGSTWIGGGMLMSVETQAFMDAVRNNQREALEAMGVPSWNVGMVDLSGSNGNLTVNMDGVTFFAMDPGMITPPTVWATDQVYGSFTTTPGSSELVTLDTDVPSLQTNFVVENWADGAGGVWGATVGTTGPGSAPGWDNVEFHGGAAGTNDTANTFSGTGAGVVTNADPAR